MQDSTARLNWSSLEMCVLASPPPWVNSLGVRGALRIVLTIASFGKVLLLAFCQPEDQSEQEKGTSPIRRESNPLAQMEAKYPVSYTIGKISKTGSTQPPANSYFNSARS
jgi:hypothetical protein